MKNLVLVGDIHGQFREMIWRAMYKYNLENTDIIVLGDFGAMDKSWKSDYFRLQKKLDKKQLHIWVLRGNHDNPEFFTGDVNFPYLTLMKDGETYEISGVSCLVLGGACSTDIVWRQEYNKKNPKKQKIWWEGEDIIRFPIKNLSGKVDLILSHEAPLSFDPVSVRFPETPSWQYQKILDSRKYLDEILKNITCSYWFYGHYHKHITGSFGNVLYKGLAELDFYDFRKNKN